MFNEHRNSGQEDTKHTPQKSAPLGGIIERGIDSIRKLTAPAVSKVLGRITGEVSSPYMGKRPKDDGEHFSTGSIEGIEQVGPQKPIGYYPIPKGTTEEQVHEMAKTYEAKGLMTHVLNRAGNFTLYIYDKTALQTLLDKSQNILQAAGWPDLAEAFVLVVASENAKPKTHLYDLIADAFGDKNNPGRTTI